MNAYHEEKLPSGAIHPDWVDIRSEETGTTDEEPSLLFSLVLILYGIR